MHLLRRAFDPQLSQPDISMSELPFRLRTVAKMRAGESDPFADPSFDPRLREKRPQRIEAD